MLICLLSVIDDMSHKSKFNEIYILYRKQMFIMAQSVVKNNADAEDIVHSVFLNIAQKYMPTVMKITDPTDLRNYLLTSTKNAAVNFINKSKRTALIEDVQYDTAVYEMNDTEFVDYVINRADYEAIIKAIRELNDTYKDVLYFYFVLDMTPADIARQLGRSVAAVKKQITRGKCILTDNLKEICYNE